MRSACLSPGSAQAHGTKPVTEFAQVRRLFTVILLLALLGGPSAAAQPVELILPDLTGAPRSLSEFRGKWVIVNFWATWCSPCLREIPELIDFQARHRDDAVVVGINFEEIEREELAAFVEKMGINYPVLQIGATPAVPFEPLKGLPSTFFVTPQGEYVASHVGPLTVAAIEDFIAREAARAP